MSFLDRVTKAVSDVVDKGKKEVDQFMRVQKINGEIGEIERKITESRNRIQQIKIQIGDTVLGMMHAGSVISAELRPRADEIGGIEQQIAADGARIAEKKAEIEKIKAEDEAAKAVAATSAVMVAPPATEPASAPPTVAPAQAPETAAVPPAPALGAQVCPQCGQPIAANVAFCAECGTTLR